MKSDGIPDLSLALPFYNEEEGADDVIRDLEESLNGAGIHYELLLVENGSRDRTGEILNRWAQKNSQIRVVKVPVNQGYGWGIISGLNAATGKYVGYMCADGQIRPADMIKVFNKIIDGGCDISKIQRVSRHDGLRRRIISFFYNRLFRFLFGAFSPDVNGTPKIFDRKYLATFQLSSKDWFIDAELILKAARARLRVEEVPVDFFARPKGKSNVRWKTIWEFIKNIVRYRFQGEKH